MSSGSERERVAATGTATSRPHANGGHESKEIETKVAYTDVPNRKITVAEALAALRLATTEHGDARMIRRALLEVLAAMEHDD